MNPFRMPPANDIGHHSCPLGQSSEDPHLNSLTVEVQQRCRCCEWGGENAPAKQQSSAVTLFSSLAFWQWMNNIGKDG